MVKTYIAKTWETVPGQWSVYVMDLKLMTGRRKKQGEGKGRGAELAVRKAARKIFGDAPFTCREIGRDVWVIKGESEGKGGSVDAAA